jgi:hypothetical protein
LEFEFGGQVGEAHHFDSDSGGKVKGLIRAKIFRVYSGGASCLRGSEEVGMQCQDRFEEM